MSLSGVPPDGSGGPGSARAAEAADRTQAADHDTGTARLLAPGGTPLKVTLLQGPGLAPTETAPRSKVMAHQAPLIGPHRLRIGDAPRGLGGRKTSTLIRELEANWPYVGHRLLSALPEPHDAPKTRPRNSSTSVDERVMPLREARPAVESLHPHVADLVLGSQFDAALRSTPLTATRFTSLVEGTQAHAFRRLPPMAQENRIDDLLREVMVAGSMDSSAGLALINRARDALCPTPVSTARFLLRSLAFVSDETQVATLFGADGHHLTALAPLEQQQALEQLAGRRDLMQLAVAEGTRFHPDQGSAATLHHFGHWLRCQGHPPVDVVLKEPPGVLWSRLEDFANDPLIQPDTSASGAWSALDIEQRIKAALHRDA